MTFNARGQFGLDYVKDEHGYDTKSPLMFRGEQTASFRHITSDEARTIYFALSAYRDTLVKDIASYHEMYAPMEEFEHRHPGEQYTKFDAGCQKCVDGEAKRQDLHKQERCRDEDLMFLGDALSGVTAILFEMTANNTDEFRDWLSV